MAEITKFNERNVAILAVIESTSGTYQAPAATDAVPVTALTGSITYETNAFKYLGDNLSRDEYTYVKDSYADISVDTFQQVLGTLNTSLLPSNAPLSEFFQAAGGACTVLSSTLYGYAAGAVIYDNVNASDSTLSIDFRKTSIQDTTNQKLWKFTYIRGSVDVSANMSEVPMLKFALKGNAYLPEISAIVTPLFGQQVLNVSPAVRKVNFVTAKVAPVLAATSISFSSTTATVTSPNHGLSNGASVEITGVKGVDGAKYNGTFTIAGVTTDTFTYTMSGTPIANATGSPMIAILGSAKDFNFSTLNAPNFFGFDLTRYLTSTEEGFSKDAVPTDVTVGMLENQAIRMSVTISSSATTATITLPTGHGLVTGNSVTVATGDAKLDGTYTVTVSGNTATYTIGSSYSSSNVAGTVVNNSATYFDPDLNISKFFSVWVKFGTGAGKYVTYKWNKLQLANVKDGKVANLFARECTFRNTGRSFIILE